MKYSEFVILADVIANGAEVLEQIKKLPRPRTLGGVTVPSNLNGLNLGQYLALGMLNQDNALTSPAEIILGITPKQIAEEPAEAVLGFDNFVALEVERINKLFASTRVQPTEDEIKAGVDDLEFGPFGIIDYFALRMGIDHDAAEATPWLRVYKCLDIDAKKNAYERRLRKVINNKSKHR